MGPRWILLGCAFALTTNGCGVRVTRLHPERPGIAGDAAETLDGDPDPRSPAGAGVWIDGTWVPRERAIVFLHVGHSNMAGRGEHPVELRPYFHEPRPGLWSFRRMEPITGVGPVELRPAVEPLSPDEASLGRAGPGMALLRAARVRAPDAHLISIGCGRSGARYGLCASFKKGGLFYEYTMEPARALRGRVTFAGLFTMLGANEYWVGDASDLSACLGQLAADVRSDLGEPDLPILFGDYEMTAFGPYLPTLPGPAAVITQLRRAVANVFRSALIPTEELPLEDDHHFNLQGHKLWGERAIGILHERGWATWTGK